MYIKKYLVLIPLSLVVFLISPIILQTYQINLWSLEFSQNALKSQFTINISHPPPTHQRAPFWFARQALELGRYNDAITVLKPFDDTNNRFASHLLGKVYQAIALQAESNKEWDEAEYAYRAAWQINPIQGALPYGNYLSQRGKGIEAELVFRKTLEDLDDNIAPHTLADIYRYLGDLLRGQERFAEALDAYENSTRINPDNYTSLRNIGWVNYEMGNTVKALEIFNGIRASHPDVADGYFDLAQIYMKEGEYAKAEQWFIQAIEKKSDSPWIWTLRANNARSAMQLDQALDFYQNVIQLWPDFALAYHEIAWCYRLRGDTSNAIESIERAIELQSPPSSWYYMRAGDIYDWAGDQDQALSAYQQALLLNPDNLPARQNVERLEK